MQLSFLAACNGLPLAKTFTATRSRPYPLVTEVDSHHTEVTTINELFDTLKVHAASGHCLIKGGLKKPLKNESRKGQSNRTAYSDLLVLDIDNLTLPQMPFGAAALTKLHVEHIANIIISELPPELHNVSFIAQASSSFGMKPTYSMHLFFMLSVPMPPATIKLWLQHTNHTSELFESQIDLSVNGQSLKYALDTSVADNSKLIFIAPPTFTDGAPLNPFSDDEDRTALVIKEQETLDLAPLMSGISRETYFTVSKKKKNQLRSDAGMSQKQEKLQTAQVNYRMESILTNPDKVLIAVSDDSASPFIRCNINGGDSNAYYFNLTSPTYMYNFKDEPIFEIEKADPDFFLSIFEIYEETITEKGQARRPIAIRDFYTDVFYAGLFDPNANQFDSDFPLTPLNKASIEGFMLSHGRPAPDFVPEAKVVFDPTQTKDTVQLVNMPYSINMYRQTDLMLNATGPDKPLSVGEGIQLQECCPTIYKIMHHMLGNGDEEFERMINWLAYIFQTKQKTGVSWVLTGVQGTGKGLFYSRILRPLFGNAHVPMKALQNIEEQFNHYMRTALFLVVDEFHMGSASQGALKIADKLKNQITEPTQTIRGMRSNQHEVPSYTNFIFLTNRLDAVNLEEAEDRRYNIGPRQEVALKHAHPEVVDNLDAIEYELPLFAGILSTFAYNKTLATNSIANDAKSEMRRVSMTVFEEFCDALKQGDVNYFAEVLQIDATALMGDNKIMTAQRYVKTWISDCQKKYSMATPAHLRTVFIALTEQNISPKDFSKKLERNNLMSIRKREVGASRDANPVRGIEIKWDVSKDTQEELIETYFSQRDREALVA